MFESSACRGDISIQGVIGVKSARVQAVSLANELGAIAKVIGANKAAEITHRRTRQARLHKVHHLYSFCLYVPSSCILVRVRLNMLPFRTLVSLEWMCR